MRRKVVREGTEPGSEPCWGSLGGRGEAGRATEGMSSCDGVAASCVLLALGCQRQGLLAGV